MPLMQMMAWIRNYAEKINSDFAEFVEFCVYEEQVQTWLSQKLSKSKIKKELHFLFSEYEKQRNYLTSLL